MICKRGTEPYSPITDPCPDCGHVWLLHPDGPGVRGNSSLKACVICELQQLMEDVGRAARDPD